jgi:Terminase RNaseH-like domain
MIRDRLAGPSGPAVRGESREPPATVGCSATNRGLRARDLRGLLGAESGDKLTRFGPFSSQWRAGNIKIRRGRWNEDLFRILEGFPDLTHDDEVDACSGALEMLNPHMKGWGAQDGGRPMEGGC